MSNQPEQIRPLPPATGSATVERPRPTIEELERMLASGEPLKIALQPDGSIRAVPIVLNAAQEKAVKEWAADDRLWTTQETVEFNLRTFARVIRQGESSNESSSTTAATKRPD